MLYEVKDANFLQFLQTKKMKAVLCDSAGKKNQIGPMIDSDSDAALSKTELSVRAPSITALIRSVEGIQAFLNLKQLTIARLNLTALPESLPPSLEILNVNINQLKQIQLADTNLKVLDVSYNDGLEILGLPPTLEVLKCANCKLKKLPTLPASLRILDCSENQLTELPELPAGIQELNCAENLLPVLPVVSESVILEASGNPIRHFVKDEISLFAGRKQDNFPLKLAVLSAIALQDLELEQELVSLLQNAAEIELQVLGYYVNVLVFLENYSIKPAQLAKVKVLYLSRVNYIFSFLKPGMSDSDAGYDITSFDGIEELPNVQVIFHLDGVNAETDWSPVRNLPNLQTIHSFSDVCKFSK